MSIPTLDKFLRDNYVDNAWTTHVSMINPKGAFQFNRKNTEIFWEIYCEKIKSNPNAMIGIAEKQQHYIPILVDIDIKIVDESIDFGEHLYSEEQVIKVISVYQSVLRQIVDNCTDENLICVLLEKPIYYIEGDSDVRYIKNGFHLHFPYLFLSKSDQETQLIPRTKEIVGKMEIFKNLGIDDSSKLIDKGSCSVPWLLYGSRKSETSNPYVITKIFDSSQNIISIEDAFKNYKLYDSQNQPFIVQDIIKYLPRILSILPAGRPYSELRANLPSVLKEKMNIERKRKSSKTTKINVKDALKMSAKLLPMLSDYRAEDRNEWLNIGWLLYNIGDGSSDALDQWIQFSKRCESKFDEDVCINEWENKMVKKDLTVGTLRYYASLDNPEKYKLFVKEQSTEFVKESLNGSHHDIAKLLYSEYGNEFVCSSIRGKEWYQFKNHCWTKIEEGVYLREKISQEIVYKYIQYGREIFEKLSTIEDKAEESMYNARLKQIAKIISNLKASPYKCNVMKEAADVFYNDKFSDKLNKDPYLVAFKNGVYDLKLNVFRDGKPEDYISKAMPIEYKVYQESDRQIEVVKDYLLRVFPDKEIRKYFLDNYSEIFVGGNSGKKIFVWNGEGGHNAKSVTQYWFEKMLGDGEYHVKLDTKYFTGKKVGSGSANPELCRTAPPVRLVTMEEPDGGEQFNIGDLKKLSGGDSFWARDLYEAGKGVKEVFPMFIITLICNKLPKIKDADQPFWNRMRVIPFESTFVHSSEECPETFEEQLRQKRFPMDLDFRQKNPEFPQALAWYLLEWRTKITNRSEPKKVLEATKVYQKQNDIYRQFVDECIIEEDGSSITISELYAHFKEWHKEGFPNSTLPIKNDVCEYFEKMWYVPVSAKKWKGMRIRTARDDSDPDVIIVGQEGYQDENIVPL